MNLTTALITKFLQDDVRAEELPHPEWGPIGEEVYKRSYSRNIVEDDGNVSPGWVWNVPVGRTTEVWAETVRRVVLGNLAYDQWTSQPGEAEELFRMIYEFKVLPGGRHLWMTGVPNAALKNCHRAGWSRDISDHFRFLAIHLFQGGGVGSNYSEVYRHRGAKVTGEIDIKLTCHPGHTDISAVKASSDGLWTDWLEEDGYDRFMVEDTREGWVDAWVYLIRAAHTPASTASSSTCPTCAPTVLRSSRSVAGHPDRHLLLAPSSRSPASWSRSTTDTCRHLRRWSSITTSQRPSLLAAPVALLV
jgi:hypothetical protein